MLRCTVLYVEIKFTFHFLILTPHIINSLLNVLKFKFITSKIKALSTFVIWPRHHNHLRDPVQQRYDVLK